jgi:hypothetical protein
MGRLSASGYLVCFLLKLMMSHGAFVVVIGRSRNVYDV